MRKLILILFVFLYGCCGVVTQKQKSVIEKKIIQFKMAHVEGGTVCSDGYKFLIVCDTWNGGVAAAQVRDEDGKFIQCHDY